MIEYKRISPLDLDDSVAIGLSLPFDSTTGIFQQNYTTVDQARDNIVNLIMTMQGERIMQPELGSTLMRRVFDNVDDITVEEIQGELEYIINHWLPYVNINTLEVTFDDNQLLYIRLIVSLVNNVLDTRSINIELPIG